MKLAWALSLLSTLLMTARPVMADEALGARYPQPALSTQEAIVWGHVQTEKFIKAREAAETLIASQPNSFVGHLALGYAHHYGEANFPKALFHENKALALFEETYGTVPNAELPWQWHARMLRELADTLGDMDRYQEQLAMMDRHDAHYVPRLRAERAWPLMKLRRFDEARLAAKEGLASGDPFQTVRALNALCAIEFEAGQDDKSYQACGEALAHARKNGRPTTVDLTNHAEAARSMFKFAEAERLLMEATAARKSWFGNPWLDLADLYMRAARFSEALSALREVPSHNERRPAHVREFDRNESRRALATFYLLSGMADEAIRITDKALVMHDRRAHNSRDPAQDRSIVALIDRRARLVQAELIEESVAALPFHRRTWAWAKATWSRFLAWRSGRLAARLIADERRLVGTFMIGTARSAIMPPWLAGELVQVLGRGVVVSAIDRARQQDQRQGASDYYDAVLAEAALAGSDYAKAVELGQRVLKTLPSGDALLRARVAAVIQEAKRRSGAHANYARALGKDPGVFRRLRIALPVKVRSNNRALKKAIVRSPRFVSDSKAALVINSVTDETQAKVCLRDRSGQSWGCIEQARQANQSQTDFNQAVLDAFVHQVFDPRVDLTQADVHSLDGANRSVRNPLKSLFD